MLRLISCILKSVVQICSLSLSISCQKGCLQQSRMKGMDEGEDGKEQPASSGPIFHDIL